MFVALDGRKFDYREIGGWSGDSNLVEVLLIRRASFK